MTNPSKQLCEICGIKPLYKVMLNGIMLDITDDKKLAEISVFKRGGVIVDTYPDFEQPENFAKLFELITTIEDFTYSTGLYYIPQIPTHKQLSRLATSEGEYESENIYAIKAFLACVVKCVAKEKDTADFIKQTEWVYE